MEAGHGSAVEEVVMTSDDKQQTTSCYYYYSAYDPRDATDVMKSLVGIDGFGLENGRGRNPCTRVVAEVGRPKRTSDTMDRPLDYYSRMGHLAETK